MEELSENKANVTEKKYGVDEGFRVISTYHEFMRGIGDLINLDEEKSIIENDCRYNLAKGNFLDYKTMEKELLKYWDSINNFNREAGGNQDLIIEKEGKTYIALGQYNEIEKVIAPIGDIKKDGNILTLDMAVELIGENYEGEDRYYTIVTYTFNTEKGLKLTHLDGKESSIKFGESKNLLEQCNELFIKRSTLSKEEYKKSLLILDKIYNGIENKSPAIDESFKKLKMSDEEFKNMSKIKDIEGQYVNGEDDFRQIIDIKLKDLDTIEFAYRIEDDANPTASVLNAVRHSGELRKSGDLWIGETSNGGFEREHKIEVKINGKKLIYKPIESRYSETSEVHKYTDVDVEEYFKK